MELTALAGRMTLGALFQQRAQLQPESTALTDGSTTLSYARLAEQVARLAGALRASGLQRGDRMAVWSENRFEYIALELAAAHLGAIVACLNWRLADEEQRHCITLVAPRMVVVSQRYLPAWERLALHGPRLLRLDETFAGWRDAHAPVPPGPDVDAEDGLVILYTSGTTGMPKGALVSQRAMIARATVFSSDYGVRPTDSFIAWSPLFHMAATDHALATLLMGGQVLVCDGLDLPRMCDWLQREPVGWLLAMPGMIEQLAQALRPLQGRLQ
ncbi:MAG: AMP-dependent synthetase and ligase, partial [Ramlibacter sp.]|nr:AMP-dependent synthetase and ligase [Ramlibacter sp.]